MRYSSIPYGNPPKILGTIDLKPTEHMLYLYLPIAIPGIGLEIPERLHFLKPLFERVFEDAARELPNFNDHFVYVTAKTLYVEHGAPGNRPGWHADGYGSHGDLNYVWYDMNPTQFAVMPFENIPDDDFESMEEMRRQIEARQWRILGVMPDDPVEEYDCGTLLRLDESVVHRVNPDVQEGVRTFIKVSVSKHRYNLKGNSHNYLLNYDWEMFDRKNVRNTDNKDFVK